MTGIWWFRIYTLPFLKLLSGLFAFVIIADFILPFAGFHNVYLIFGIPFLALFKKFTPGSFRENIEFHKMNVPFSELRKAFLSDIFITIASYFVFSALAVFISWFFGGFFSRPYSDIFWNYTFAMFFYFSFFFCFLVSWACFTSVDKRYLFYNVRNKTSFKFFLHSGSIWMTCMFLIVAAVLVGLTPEVGYTHVLGSVVSATTLFILRAMFHKGPAEATLFKWFQYFAVGNMLFVSAFGVSCLLGRSDVFNSDLTVEARSHSFEFYGVLGPRLDKKTFKLIEPRLNHGNFALTGIYQRLDFDPSELGLSYFLDKSGDQHRLISFLNLGKPSPEFLMKLYSDLESNLWFWDKVKTTEVIRQLAFHRWPEKRPLPEKFLAEKKKASDFAELNKRKRSLASGR